MGLLVSLTLERTTAQANQRLLAAQAAAVLGTTKDRPSLRITATCSARL
jgi:hypothetical protein